MKRVITASGSLYDSSEDAQRFSSLYGSANRDDWPDEMKEIKQIARKYPSKYLFDIYDKASPEDKSRLMELVQRMHQSTDTPTINQLRSKFRKLENGYDRDTLNEYDRGYYEAMYDMIQAFGIKEIETYL